MSLSDAIIHGSAADVAAMIDRGAPIDFIDVYGYTPLIETAIANDVEKAKLVLNAGADVDQRDITKRTALHWATANNNFEMCKILLEKGANPNAYNIASEPVLVQPLLRKNKALKELLVEHGANYQFAYDYINAKLLGHRFELIGSVDIVDPNDIFTEVDYEGFFIEFSTSLISHSLKEFRDNFAARALTPWFKNLNKIIAAYENGEKLLHFDHYLKDYRRNMKEIDAILKQEPIVIPIGQEGHAISLVKYGHFLAICDRIADKDEQQRVPIYYMNRTNQFRSEFLAELIFKPQKIETIITALKSQLGLQQIGFMPLSAQFIGNCSWANMEACIAPLYFMLQMSDSNNQVEKSALIDDAMELFNRWRHWDTERALKFFMDGFATASKARKASIAALLAGIIFQRHSAENRDHVERAKKILKIIMPTPYSYVFDSYLKFYVHNRVTEAGKNLQNLLKIYELEEAY